MGGNRAPAVSPGSRLRSGVARVVVVIQARMGSSRLPGKVLRSLGGVPVVEWCARRCEAAELVDRVVIATTTNAEDDDIAAWADGRGLACFRGSADDVLERYHEAVEAWEPDADIVVRVTSDCPSSTRA